MAFLQVQVSLEVLENYVPAFYRDARKVYNEMMREQMKNENKVTPAAIVPISENLVHRCQPFG